METIGPDSVRLEAVGLKGVWLEDIVHPVH